MGKFLDIVKTRRSIRSYTNAKIGRALLEQCIEAARFAPSACNSQPWKFIIVDEPGIVTQIAEATSHGIMGSLMNSFTRRAAAFIVIVIEKNMLPSQIGGLLRKTDFSLIDAGIACEHIVLQATEFGIGTCILGWFDEKRIVKILGIPPEKRVGLVIAMGYPEETELKERKLKERARVIAFNKYS